MLVISTVGKGISSSIERTGESLIRLRFLNASISSESGSEMFESGVGTKASSINIVSGLTEGVGIFCGTGSLTIGGLIPALGLPISIKFPSGVITCNPPPNTIEPSGIFSAFTVCFPRPVATFPKESLYVGISGMGETTLGKEAIPCSASVAIVFLKSATSASY